VINVVLITVGKSDIFLSYIAAIHIILASKETSMKSLATRQRDLHILYLGTTPGRKLK